MSSLKPPRLSLDWWKMKFFEVVVSGMLISLVISASQMVSQRQKDLLPASSWFDVVEVFVPDHVAGSNPILTYDREIRETFTGFWIAEVQELTPNGRFRHECSGSGINVYEEDEILIDDSVDWDWFIGNECAVDPGTYRLRVNYTLRRVGWPEKELTVTSNLFRVLALQP